MNANTINQDITKHSSNFQRKMQIIITQSKTPKEHNTVPLPPEQTQQHSTKTNHSIIHENLTHPQFSTKITLPIPKPKKNLKFNQTPIKKPKKKKSTKFSIHIPIHHTTKQKKIKIKQNTQKHQTSHTPSQQQQRQKHSSPTQNHP